MKRRRRSSLEELEARVSQHVRAGKGISNRVLQRFCSNVCTKKFAGVYSADRLPGELTARGSFIAVVNLGKRRGVGGRPDPGHFVTIVGERGRLWYLDPYGLPVFQPHVLQFLDLRRRRWTVIENTKQIQDADSYYCGLYAILFSMYYDLPRRQRGKVVRFEWHKRRKDLKKNDALCVKYIRELLRRRHVYS